MSSSSSVGLPAGVVRSKWNEHRGDPPDSRPKHGGRLPGTPGSTRPAGLHTGYAALPTSRSSDRASLALSEWAGVCAMKWLI